MQKLMLEEINHIKVALQSVLDSLAAKVTKLGRVERDGFQIGDRVVVVEGMDEGLSGIIVGILDSTAATVESTRTYGLGELRIDV